MFNEFLFNTTEYNGFPVSTASSNESTDPITFNGFGLFNDDIICQRLLIQGPSREFATFSNPNRPGETNTLDFFRRGTITLEGHVIKTTGEELENCLDTITRNLRPKEKYLIVTKDNGKRRYLCTWTNTNSAFNARQNYNIEFTPFTFVFTLIDPPFGEDTFLTSQSTPGLTDSVLDVTIDNTGSHETFLNTVMVVNSASGLSEINIKNLSTGEEMSFNPSVTGPNLVKVTGEVVRSGEILTGADVTVDGSNISYDGRIPELRLGTNIIRYTITSTSHNIDLTSNTRIRYLL